MSCDLGSLQQTSDQIILPALNPRAEWGRGRCGGRGQWVGGVRGGADHMWVQLRDPQSVCGDDIITDTHTGADLWSVPLPVAFICLSGEAEDESSGTQRNDQY